jgi:phosphoribosylanthranilate isomerase
MIIKVCGMKEEGNMLALSKLDIDYMGMIFYERSPRYITRVLSVKFPDRIKKTGVFVNAAYDEIMDKATIFGLDAIQLHGNESPGLCERLKNNGLEILKAFGIDADFDFHRTAPFENSCSLFVFDTKTKSHGGSGKKYNWDKLSEYQGKTRFLLSGGITPNDVENIKQFDHPLLAGVDLNSGFEIKPGIKDIQALKVFLKKLQE